MTSFVFQAHSGLRYLVLAVGLVVLLHSLWCVVTRRPYDRGNRILLAILTGILDLQLVAGLVLVFLRPFYTALMGHIGTMVLAVVVAHVASVLLKRVPDAKRTPVVPLVASAAILVLVVLGILAIGRSPV